MVKKILQVPVKVVKGTYKAWKFAYKLASGALLGAAIYKSIQKVRESHRVPDELPLIPEPPLETPKPRVKRKKAKKRKAKKK